MNPRKYVPPTTRHPMLQHEHVVRKLLDAHENLQYQQAIHATAKRFGISESEVQHILDGGDFIVRTR